MSGGFFEIVCPVCNEPVPEQGFKRRRIPSRGGRKMRVHEHCAEVVDAQETLAGPDGQVLGERPKAAA